MTKKKTEPLGLVDVTDEEYNADQSAVRKSWLDYIDRSPAHLQAYLREEMTDTPAMRFGRLVHCAVLEPDMLESRYAVIPKHINRRTKAGKEEFAAWGEEHENFTIVTDDDLQMAADIRDSILHHKGASALLGKGDREQTIFWVDPETGERCKARADLLRDSLIVDVKTTVDARPEPFARSIANYNYDMQVAHYDAGFERGRFAFIAVEKTPPYGVAVYLADDWIFERGILHRNDNMRVYHECRETDLWPGYDDAVQLISLPKWARKKS